MTNPHSRVMHIAHALHRNGFALSWANTLKYAWYFERLRKWMQTGIVTFSYFKTDGTIREARGTLSPSLIPDDKKPKGSIGSTPTYSSFPYFDLDRNAWRSFRLDNFIVFVTLES